MSCNYADELSEYEDKGVCGLPEVHDDPTEVDKKIFKLVEMIKKANHVVVHTGAGISTAAGIPDFRGPKGVWTLEQQGRKPEINISFNEAVPTQTHMSLVALANKGYLHFLISQNVDGLHLRSNFPLEKFVELHGNMFLDKCNQCQRIFIRNKAASTVGQKSIGHPCPLPKSNGRSCRGKLCDTVLDWEDELSEKFLEAADYHSRKADLSICLGSTLQIVPSGKLPVLTKNSGGKLVICNLQPTKHDKLADLIIHEYVDVIMCKLSKLLGVEIPDYQPSCDPTKHSGSIPKEYSSQNLLPNSKFSNKLNKRTKEVHQTEHSVTYIKTEERSLEWNVSESNKVKTEEDNLKTSEVSATDSMSNCKRTKLDVNNTDTVLKVNSQEIGRIQKMPDNIINKYSIETDDLHQDSNLEQVINNRNSTECEINSLD